MLRPWPLLLLALARAQTGEKLAELQRSLQSVLDSVAAKHAPNSALQLGWKSADAEFTLAAGEVQRPDEATSRKVTVDDTFLWGSGTKPFTAAAVMSLVAAGKVKIEDPLEKHVDGVLDKLHKGASLTGLFGKNASKITVGQTLRMQSGVQDFDFPPFDNYLLRSNESYKTHSPYEFVQYASTQKPLLLCDPGTCASYSSNNFILAGFILLAHANATEWWQLDLASFFPAAARKSLRGLRFFEREMLQEMLTVPGKTGGGWAKTPKSVIWNQSSTILGWTCGNAVGTALDVAGFMWDLLGPEASVLPPDVLKEMTKFEPLNLGWGAGMFQYGAGLMIENVKFARKPPHFPDWGSYMGHGGDTYGFLSEAGIVAHLNASMAIVANEDSDSIIVSHNAFCKAIRAAARVLQGRHLLLFCASDEEESLVV